MFFTELIVPPTISDMKNLAPRHSELLVKDLDRNADPLTRGFLNLPINANDLTSIVHHCTATEATEKYVRRNAEALLRLRLGSNCTW